MLDALAGYRCTDEFFGLPFVDVDEARLRPVPHRYVHGGFEGTATRFSFCFPDHDGTYQGRLFHYLSGGFGGNEHGPTADMPNHFAGIGYTASRGGFLIETNQGHVGAEPCPKAGSDGTVYAWRASAESARLARHLGAAVYGTPVERAYLFGPSGGGVRTTVAMEHAPDGVWDAGVASVVGSPNTFHKFAAMNNARRLIGARFDDVVDAVDPGGSGDPYAGLATRQREALADLYACGFPRGSEWSVAKGLNAGVFLWTWQADLVVAAEREYFDAFWSQPGHAGVDGALDEELLDIQVKVARTVRPAEALRFPISSFGRMLLTAPEDKQVGIVLEGDEIAAVEGARLTFTTGAAAGRSLYCVTSGGGLIVGSSIGEAQTLLFDGVEPGDEVHVDNRDFLAYCYSYRHHPGLAASVGRLAVDGRPLYPQHAWPDDGAMSSPVFGGVGTTGALRRPMFLIQHTLDTSGWPAGGARYAENVAAHAGAAIDDRFRFWWLDNAEHISGTSIAVHSRPAPATRLIDYGGAHEAAIDAMVAWIEQGDPPPASTPYALDDRDNGLTLPGAAAERRGIQPVATATANGVVRADVRVGEPVTLVVDAATPPGAGTVVEIAWDFEGSGTWPSVHRPTPAAQVRHEVMHRFEEPGTYFPSVRVFAHRTGDADDPYARVMNLGRCRVVVE